MPDPNVPGISRTLEERAVPRFIPYLNGGSAAAGHQGEGAQ